MAVGYEVNKPIMDTKVAQAVLVLRDAMNRCESIATWLVNNPVVEGTEPLTQPPFEYTVDEAYLIRLFFEQVEAIRVNNQSLENLGRKLTGLE